MSQPPPKPWERRIPGTIPAPLNYRSADFGSTAQRGPSVSGPPVLTRVAPPIPPRPVQQTYRPTYSSFHSSYSPYGSSIYGGYSPHSYSGYGIGGGLGYNRYQNDDIPPSQFVQQAEESSRGAFQSIESIVHAFSSVSMMMDATFSAVYNSFRAVLDVANHFSRLRIHFTKVLSAFALVRTLRYLYRRLQRLLGLRADSEVDDLWADSATSTVVSASGGAGIDDPRVNSVKSWPIFLFFAVVLGGPYLIWRLLRSAEGSEENATSWASGEDDHVVARAEYDFTASSEEEISLQAGDMLNLAPKEQQPRVRGWLLASVDGQTTGLIPANYVKVLGRRRGRKHAELERLAQAQQAAQNLPSSQIALNSASPSASNSTPAFHGLSEPHELMESVYGETHDPHSALEVHPSTNDSRNNVDITSEKIDL
ncbi:peroxisome biogenesis factor 13 [Triplophysa rosa]|uniref:Peroxisomal membrane protein PEX13 n=1 Tax=Triplophysa rosa TaxID=992332 RepID=A0A9W7TXU5_TRIRA|nr:peroxisome biogenesis factor 13 [Triplophysa rosa]KAI7804742.1 peroxisomal biogenesis factor 13 [Triplophysa rosa]